VWDDSRAHLPQQLGGRCLTSSEAAALTRNRGAGLEVVTVKVSNDAFSE
jgi:hypothetical protein